MDLAAAQAWRAARSGDAGRGLEPLESIPEARLVALATGGRPDAYGELVRRHQAGVYNVALRLLGEREEALDVAQEAFVRAYDNLAGFDTARPFAPWINRIVTNLALNALQSRRPAALRLDDAERTGAEGEALADLSGEPEQIFLAGEQQRLLRRIILGLPPRYRAVIELRHYQDRSYEEIAATLSMSLSDVRSNLFRARRELRKRLEESE